MRRRLARFMADQLRELDEFAEEAGLTVGAARCWVLALGFY